ncbi:MAG: hypothetical protein HKN16_13360, partial [Saprospiraceae bacterium]|nr:hypothetical protein [Saprospiraceae bacterium]
MTRKSYLLFGIFMCFVLGNTYAQSEGLKITAKPKNMWELGIHVGHSILTGDVDWDSDFGVGLHLRKALDYTFSVRFDGTYNRLSGTEEENRREVDANRYGFGTNWMPEYESTYINGDISVVASLNQMKIFKKNKINPYGFVGLGIGSANVEVTDGNNTFDVDDDILYDDEWNINPHAVGGMGIGFLVGKKISISVEHKLTKFLGRGADLMDGVEFQGRLSDRVITKDDDLMNYTNVRVGIGLGKLDEDQSLPLWWVSPLDMIAEDLAEVKARPIFDDSDSDGDGVLDMVDQEPDTPEGYPVDTRGNSLDSDGDGLVDGMDEEPYSPPGYEVDSKGIAQVPQPNILNENDVNKIIDGRLANWTPSTDLSNDWF